jgi:hypothetical protein
MLPEKGPSLYVALTLDRLCSGRQSRGVPPQLRIQYPGAMYHVMSRGNRRQDIFLDDVDRQDRGQIGVRTNFLHWPTRSGRLM